MPQSIFVNLPVADLARSRAFHEALGFSIDENFTDETAACVVISEAIHLMILTHERFEGFSVLPRADTTSTTGVLIALSRDSREGVDDMLRAALENGAKEPKPADDHGWMYMRTFMDPDGHVFEAFWMDAEAALAARKLES
ncbi:VOC family protein [Cereibacter sphaeroides]|uniref:VOC family protein n=1 Tax=Cereibacter sphaeroides TaxID=1063 RepID=UPI001F482E37|nr:VOC family protein [Cereibacter sphaeroides]MCE6951445.1 VOC family protein [Cereibacter sphaeroides]MCE6960770.1 VOC family protein [Cereibacter sphaeroides]MCE6969964.1 VOC family protein [Cereibacter sphaeroides]MCE6974352.1 VOC family protein [Cereibacter sphaeroides]